MFLIQYHIFSKAYPSLLELDLQKNYFKKGIIVLIHDSK